MMFFEKSTFIRCDVNELYDFHTNTNNIRKITPEDTSIKIIDCEEKSYEGKIIKLRVVKFFLPINWEVQIIKLNPPNLFIDKALKSPFKSWEHQHVFTQMEGMSKLQDMVRFELPFGFVGGVFNSLILKQIQSEFNYRHLKTKRILENS